MARLISMECFFNIWPVPFFITTAFLPGITANPKLPEVGSATTERQMSVHVVLFRRRSLSRARRWRPRTLLLRTPDLSWFSAGAAQWVPLACGAPASCDPSPPTAISGMGQASDAKSGGITPSSIWTAALPVGLSNTQQT